MLNVTADGAKSIFCSIPSKEEERLSAEDPKQRTSAVIPKTKACVKKPRLTLPLASNTN